MQLDSARVGVRSTLIQEVCGNKLLFITLLVKCGYLQTGAHEISLWLELGPPPPEAPSNGAIQPWVLLTKLTGQSLTFAIATSSNITDWKSY